MLELFKSNQKFKFNLLCFTALASLNLYSNISFASNIFRGYLGTDLLLSKIRYKKDYGANIYNKDIVPGINIFAGNMFNHTYGIEIGYEINKPSKNKNVVVQPGQMVAGLPLAGAINAEYDSKQQQKHFYVGGVIQNSLSSNWYCSLILGISIAKINSNHVLLTAAGVPIGIYKNFSKTKLIPLIKLIPEYKLSNHISTRAMISWKNTARIKAESKEIPTAKINLRNTFSVSLGFVYYVN